MHICCYAMQALYANARKMLSPDIKNGADTTSSKMDSMMLADHSERPVPLVGQSRGNQPGRELAAIEYEK